MHDKSGNTVIYILTNHPLVRLTIAKVLSRYHVELFSQNHLTDNSRCDWMLIVDAYSVAEWIATITKYGFRQGRPILILTDELPAEAEELRLVYLGVRGIVRLANLDTDLVQAVGSVMNGQLWLRRATLAEHVIRKGGQNAKPLSVREEQILAFLLNGSSNKEIGNSLGISDRTVKFHVSNILRKFKVKNRRGLLKSKWPATETTWSVPA